jgi:hypothetical protein
MESFFITVENKNSGITVYEIKRKALDGVKKVVYSVKSKDTGPIFYVTTEKETWIQVGPMSVVYDQGLIEKIGKEIELEDDENFNEYDEEAELRRMFPDEDSMEGFDWTLGD